MKRILVLVSFLLCLLPAFAASPLFLGSTTDYVTNAGGTILFVYSNNVRVVYMRGTGLVRFLGSEMQFTNTSISNPNTRIDIGHASTNGNFTERFHFGDDMGQTFSWQRGVETNRVYIQRANADTDFPFMVTRGGVKLGSAGATTTNIGDLFLTGALGMTNQGQKASIAVAPTNNVLQTNFLGTVQAAAASVLEAAFNQFSELVVTQRISAATTITLTNGSPGFPSMWITLLGEASGGSSRNVTLVANTGQLIGNLDVSTALATSYTFALPAGNGVEISDEIRQLNGTNVHKIITRQFTF